MKSVFRKWDVDQGELFPPAFKDLVPPDHLVHFVRRIVGEDLDLSAIYSAYTASKGQPPYHPALMVALLLYGYCRGVYSSRKIELACEERLDFRALVGGERPDHSTIAEFRKRHGEALSQLFVQVLALCRDAGMVKMGHVALDGTKVRASASKHAAMSYKRMKQAEPKLAAEVDEWLKSAQKEDDDDDDQFGEGNRGDEIPEHIKAKARKLAKIRAAKQELEEKAQTEKERVERERAEREAEQGHKLSGRKPKALEGVPNDNEQRNFTDPESRIMVVGGGFEQCYNAQAAVDAESQVIVAEYVTDAAADNRQLIPLLQQIKANVDCDPEQVSADAGYCSEENLEYLETSTVDGYVATGRQRHGTASPTANEERNRRPRATRMREKLRSGGWESPYRLRKHTVEPVFGQIKGARGFRQFLRRGLRAVGEEWSLLATAHNLLKLAAWQPAVGS